MSASYIHAMADLLVHHRLPMIDEALVHARAKGGEVMSVILYEAAQPNGAQSIEVSCNIAPATVSGREAVEVLWSWPPNTIVAFLRV